MLSKYRTTRTIDDTARYSSKINMVRSFGLDLSGSMFSSLLLVSFAILRECTGQSDDGITANVDSEGCKCEPGVGAFTVSFILLCGDWCVMCRSSPMLRIYSLQTGVRRSNDIPVCVLGRSGS